MGFRHVYHIQRRENWHQNRARATLMSMYESWMLQHGKSDNALGEKEKRFEIFKYNLRHIDEQNIMSNRTLNNLNRSWGYGRRKISSPNGKYGFSDSYEVKRSQSHHLVQLLLFFIYGFNNVAAWISMNPSTRTK